MKKKPTAPLKRFHVCYQVRYGPSRSGASRMEESGVFEAPTARAAQRQFRARDERLPNGRGWYEVGRHVSTRELKEVGS